MLRFSIRGLLVLATVVALAAGGAARAEEKVLRWKFKPGDTRRFNVQQEISQKINVGGQATTITTTHEMTMAWKVESVDADGVAKMTQTIDRITMKSVSAQGVMMEYDSSTDKEPQGMAAMVAPIYKSMLGKPFVMWMNSQGRVVEMKLPQGMLENLNKMAGGAQLGSLFSEDGLKQMSQTAVLPEEPVTPGKSWEQETSINNPALGKQTFKTRLTYLGTEERGGKPVEKIGLEMEIRQEAKGQMVAMDITKQKSQGTIYFDNEAGQPVGSEMTMSMTMTLEVAGQKVDLDMEMTQQVEEMEGEATKPE